ncbi:DUF2273 domain-containing protein [Spirochaetota bacterium]
MDFFKFIMDWINENPGKAVGAIIGFLLGIFILTLGILKTIIIIIFIIIGFVIGKSRDDNVSIIDEITGIFKKDKDDGLDDEDL